MNEKPSYFDLILDIFFNYKDDSFKDVEKMEKDFKSLGKKYLNYLSFDYPERIKKIKEGIILNENFLLSIVNKYENSFNKYKSKINIPNRRININKLRSTLKLFIRDWTSEGKKERDITYNPIISEIKKYFSDDDNKNKKILVPGAGLCRLAFEIAKFGFQVDAIEVSYFMILGSSFLFNAHINKNEFKIQPLIHSFNCLKKENDPFQLFHIPDENINDIINSKDFGKLNIIPGDFIISFKDKNNCYDAVITSFFLDTANNIIQFIEIIYNILKKGGIWINIGPLLYHFHDIENEVSIELSLEEIKKIILKFGFELKNEQMIDTTYSEIEERLKSTIFTCIFFTAIKK